MSRIPFNQFVYLEAKPGRQAELQAALQEIVSSTRAEDGPACYDLFQSEADPTRFVIYEGWDSQEALDRHSRSPRFLGQVAALGGLVAGGSGGKPFSAEPLVMLSDRSERPRS